MKFAKVLATESVPEWRAKYVNYKQLKKLVKAIRTHFTSESNHLGSTNETDPLVTPTSSLISPLLSIPTPTSPLLSMPTPTSPLLQMSSPTSPVISRSSTPIRQLRTAALRNGDHSASNSDVETSPTTSLLSPQKPIAGLDTASRQFFQQIDAEAEKINTFYLEKQKEFMKRFDVLLDQIQEFSPAQQKSSLQSQKAAHMKMQETANRRPMSLMESFAEETAVMDKVIRRRQQRRRDERKLSVVKRTIQNTTPIKPVNGSAIVPQPFSIRSPTSPNMNSTNSTILIEWQSRELQVDSSTISHWPRLARHRLRLALLEFYRGLILLQTFGQLNKTAFTKIMKKYEKTMRQMNREPAAVRRLYLAKVEAMPFCQNPIVQQLLEQVENLFIALFAEGDRSRGMDRLRLPDRTKVHHGVTFRTGLMLGVMVPLMILTLFQFPSFYNKEDPMRDYVLSVYAGLSLPLLGCWLLGANVAIWDRYGINYRFIFELDARDHLDVFQFLEWVAVFTSLWIVAVYVTINGVFNDWISLYLQPLILTGLYLFLIMMPFPIFYASARKWLVRVLIRIVTAPYYSVKFKDFFLADQFSSLTFTLKATLGGIICAHSASLVPQCSVSAPLEWYAPLLMGLPAMWRLLQCIKRYTSTRRAWPHLFNGGKYAMSLSSTYLLGLYRLMHNDSTILTVALIVASFSSCFSLFWDIRMDWDLMQKSSRYWLLRDQLMYPSPLFYYWILFSNIVLRWTWIIPLLPSLQGRISPILLAWLIALLELVRRFQWNFLRLENEHANNCGAYRAVIDLPLPFSSAATVATSPKHAAIAPQSTRLVSILLEEEEEEMNPLSNDSSMFNETISLIDEEV